MQQNHQTTLLPTAASTGGLFSWSNPSRITADDGSSAVLFPGGSSSGWIRGSTFGFSLPPFAVIDGIGVLLDGSEGDASSDVSIGISGTDTLNSVLYGTEIGGSEFKWGLDEITIADLASLEVTVDTETFGASGSASLDAVFVTVYWHVELNQTQTDVPTRIVYKTYSREGVYLGELPNVTSKLSVAQDINSAGSSIVITCGEFLTNEVTVSPLLTEAGDVITTEDDDPILATSTDLVVASGDSPDLAIFKNSNRIKAWLYNKYYPNGKLVFSGQVNRVQFKYASGSAGVAITVYSDGFDMANYLLTPSSSYSYTNDVSQTSQNTYSTATLYIEGFKTIVSRLFLGQTFKTGAIAKLGAVKLMLMGAADVTVQVYSAVNGSFLGGGTVSVNAPTPTEVQIPFTTPFAVSSNTSYFFMVAVNNNQSIRVYRTTANPYADGSAYQMGVNGVWSALTGDLYFVTQSASDGNTTTTFTSDDPVTDMASQIIADYNSRGGFVTEDEFTATGLSLTYTFNSTTVFDAIRKIIELSPTGYYMSLDLGTAQMDIKQINSSADFSLVRGRDINSLDIALSSEQVKNQMLFVGGDTGGGNNLYKEYLDTESVSNYGLRVVLKSDNRVTIANTANAIGDTFIEENSTESQETTVMVLNDYIDITLLEVGKTVGFRNFGNFIDDLVLQIVRREVNYSEGIVNLGLGRLPVRMNDEVQRISRELLDQQTLANPSSPS